MDKHRPILVRPRLGGLVKKLVIAAVLMVFGAACSEGSDPGPSTPRITEGVDDGQLTKSLVSLEEIEDIPDAPGELVEQPIQDVSAFENPDPRGPCGAKISQPTFEDAALVAFATTQPPHSTIVQAVWDLPDDEAEEFLEAHRRDARPGCPTYTSSTPTGTQEVQFLEEVDISGEALATKVRLKVKDAAPFYGAVGMARRGTFLSLIMIFGEKPVSSAFLRGSTLMIARAL